MAIMSCVVVLAAAVIATITDVSKRMIYRSLTVPVFLFGLVYTADAYWSYCQYFSFTEQGFRLLVYIIGNWLGPSILVFGYSLLLFWLGVLDGGDGQFLIAITPWCGAYRMCRIILWFYPAAFIFLLLYLLHKYSFNIRELLKDQFNDMIALLTNIPAIINNIKNREPSILTSNIPYKSCQIGKPPGMAAISASILLSYFI